MGLFNKWDYNPEEDKARRQQLTAEIDEENESEEKDEGEN
jgi:hypothetical protein